jgi:hypothetical protein
MKLLVIQFSPPSRHSIPLWSKYSPQYPVHQPIDWHPKSPNLLYVAPAANTCRLTIQDLLNIVSRTLDYTIFTSCHYKPNQISMFKTYKHRSYADSIHETKIIWPKANAVIFQYITLPFRSLKPTIFHLPVHLKARIWET